MADFGCQTETNVRHLIQVRSQPIRDEVSVSLIAELWAELGALYGDVGPVKWTPEPFEQPGSQFMVAWALGEPVGCGAFKPLESKFAEVNRIFVRPEWRRRGISSAIMSALEISAAGFGYEELWLETGLVQPGAIALYESLGYSRIPCYGQYADDPLSVCFGKQLTSAECQPT